ncbi:MAG: 6-phosphofructokinase [Candidatus Methylomirabilales bacterium]
MKRLGILTGGGDCPGLNAVIRAVVRKAVDHHSLEVLGIKQGWVGLMREELRPLSLRDISGILPKGGTILETSRVNPFTIEDGPRQVQETMQREGIEALIVVGGEGTLKIATRFSQMGVNLVGVPKTIDNDIARTDLTFGFDTAVAIATEAIDRLHSTAEAHHRVMVLEVMGRNAGWIATLAGIAGGADCILIPEAPFTMAEVCELIMRRHERGKDFSIIVVAEGAKPPDLGLEESRIWTRYDDFGRKRLGGIGTLVGNEIEQRCGIETRVTILGHVQRGGSPTPFDRVLASRFGIAAVDMVLKGDFGKMVSLQGNKVTAVPLEEAVATYKEVDPELFEIAKIFFG